MANPFEYIFFEPDQVLTNEHLNETFDYLDQQNRWTRNKLLGIGIVCGFDLVLNPGVIEVTKGCGITSQGYLIMQDTTSYTHYITYPGLTPPKDPLFDYPGPLPFYAPFCKGKNVWRLLTEKEYDNLEAAQKLTAPTLSSAKTFLLDYAVVLFLEVTETSLKNCNMLDCNNAGSTIDFAARALLVAIKDLPGAVAGNVIPYLPHEINLKRFNVPYTAINNANDVVNAFVNIVDDTTLTAVSNAYIYSFDKFGAMLNVAANPFNNLLTTLKNYRNMVLTHNPVFIQYFYDFIDDLIKAYFEFTVKMSSIIGNCCPDENLFPLHLVLGEASVATDAFAQDSYRNYFMYSSLFSQMGNDLAGAVLLFNRMVIMVNKFTVQSTSLQREAIIRITPSQYEFPWLSERAIPYYYKPDAAGAELYKYWNYYKTSHGSAAFNLSYNANLYNTNTAVTQPLLYDIEHYNFFRVEGIVGQNYNNVLANILNQRSNYNLPFDVVAVSADQLQTGAVLPQCNMNDLDTDYKLIISETACKIHLVFCFVSKLPYSTYVSTSKAKATRSLYEINKPKVMKFSSFKLQRETFMLLPVTFSNTYQKGDFLNKYCPALEDTIGSGYLAALSNSGEFTNPVQIDQSNPLTIVYYYLFEFIDSVESLMYILNTNTLAQLDIAAFNTAYQTYLTDTLLALGFLVEFTVVANNPDGQSADKQLVTLTEDTELDLLIDEMTQLTNLCIDELLKVLKDEYSSRLSQYQDQLNFLSYYKKHPGLEHKAGVPKGGTLVLVYHTAPADNSATNANAANTGADITNAAFRDFNITNLDTSDAPAKRVVATEEVTPALSALDDHSISVIRRFVNECKDAPVATKNEIFHILKRVPVKTSPTYNIQDGAVIADFYIPYMCCSDCPPVTYVVQPPVKPPPPPPPKPKITMATTFCDNDAKPEPIQVSAPGGTFNTVKGLDGAKLTFTPATAGAGHYSIIYTLDGVASDPATVTVLPTPVSTFNYANNGSKETGGFFFIEVNFTADKVVTGYDYEWTFGKGFQITQAKGPVQNLTIEFYAHQGDVPTQVTLLVSNGNCHNLAVTNNYIISAQGLTPDTGSSEKSFIKGIENLFTKNKKKK